MNTPMGRLEAQKAGLVDLNALPKITRATSPWLIDPRAQNKQMEVIHYENAMSLAQLAEYQRREKLKAREGDDRGREFFG